MPAHDALDVWTAILQLDGFRVVHVQHDTPSDAVRLTVIPTTRVGICPHCQRASATVHRRHTSDPIRDLPLGAQTVDLIVRTDQYACTACACFFTPIAPVLVQHAHATERFLAQAARLIRFSDLTNAAAFFGVAEKTLEKWYYDYVLRQQQEPAAVAKSIRQIGIDELSVKKKGQRYVAVIVDHTNGRVLEVLESREQSVVLAYLRHERATGLLAGVVEVTTDMWSAYVTAARAVFGAGVRITIDRFHVMKNFQEQLTAARREIQRQLPKAAATALKGMRWLWLTNDANLTAQERAELAAAAVQFPRLGQLRAQREQLRALFEDTTIRTAAAGAQRLRVWMQQARTLGVQALARFCQTLENWLEPIANYFVTRASNGRVEGFNMGLRGILHRAFGMLSFEHFRLRVLDRFGRPKSIMNQQS